uniref:N-acetylmuramoyl-L-alanine amidase n=1 Tax=uncultured marine virus TaxID=186617 RepID=A0A0F7L7N8_9VIRU|nr:N-acetylmuramoyl-L-alanine amidase [uncultured marine virus]
MWLGLEYAKNLEVGCFVQQYLYSLGCLLVVLIQLLYCNHLVALHYQENQQLILLFGFHLRNVV